MTTWVLILFFYNGPVAIQGYKSPQECEASFKKIQLTLKNWTDYACVPGPSSNDT
jgi:TATA-box binding protein (TBP) (component of TFIID and TFIIIB)